MEPGQEERESGKEEGRKGLKEKTDGGREDRKQTWWRGEERRGVGREEGEGGGKYRKEGRKKGGGYLRGKKERERNEKLGMVVQTRGPQVCGQLCVVGP